MSEERVSPSCANASPTDPRRDRVTAHRRPNFLLIISDDHGYGDHAAEPTEEGLHTPNLERLRAEGVTFTRGYVSAPVCSPSRAGLIAGAHQARWGARWFDTAHFPTDEIEVGPETLRRAGYRTGYFGKVHYGPDAPGSRSCPERHGFDESLYGLAAQSMGRLHYLKHSAAAAAEEPEVARRHGTHPLFDGGEPVDTDTHLTELFADRAIDFIERASSEEEAYFCMVAFNAVHNFTWQLPEEELERHGLPRKEDFDPAVEEYVDWYDGAISPNFPEGRAYYLAQLDLMDRHIGRLLDAADENTVIVYLTDNGGSTCNYGDNGPLDGTKYTLYEGGIRVPFLVRWPGLGTPGSSCDALVSALDLVPTFVAAAAEGRDDGLGELPRYDGQDLRDVLGGGSPGHEALYFDTGFQQAVVRPEAKWRRLTEESAPMREAILRVEHTDIGEGESLVRFEDGLADEIDPAAQVDDPALLDELRQQFTAWQATTQADMRAG